MLKNRCVYAYFTKKNGVEIPYYVGKGSINRPFQSHGRIITPKDVNRIRILGYDMSDVDARQAEILLIALYKRSFEGGSLVNMLPGGDYPAGVTPLQETQAAKNDIKFWERNPEFRLIDSGGYWVGNHYPEYRNNYGGWTEPINPLQGEEIIERRVKQTLRKRDKYRQFERDKIKWEREERRRIEITEELINNHIQLEEIKKAERDKLIAEGNRRYDALFHNRV